MPWWADQLVPELLMKTIQYFAYTNVDTLNICMKEIDCKKNYNWQNDKLLELRQFFWLVFNRGYAWAMIVHTWADQLQPQLMMEQFDTLPQHYGHFVFWHHCFYWPLPCGGYQISIAYCLFFILGLDVSIYRTIGTLVLVVRYQSFGLEFISLLMTIWLKSLLFEKFIRLWDTFIMPVDTGLGRAVGVSFDI